MSIYMSIYVYVCIPPNKPVSKRKRQVKGGVDKGGGVTKNLQVASAFSRRVSSHSK